MDNNNEKEVRKYLDFMYNEKNYMNCKECPENIHDNRNSSGFVQPCGQQHCWVAAHCWNI